MDTDPDPTTFDGQITTTLLLTHAADFPNDPLQPPSPPPSPDAADADADAPADIPIYYLLPYHIDRLLASARTFQWVAAITLLSDSTVAQSRIRTAIEVHIAEKHLPAATLSSSFRVRVLINRAADVAVESTPIVSTPYLSKHNGIFFPTSLGPPGETLMTSTPEPLSDAVPANPAPPQPTSVHLYPHPVPSSAFTAHKTTHRPHYTLARNYTLTLTVPTQPNANTSMIPITTSEVLLQNPSHQITEASLSTPYFHRNGHWITPSASCGGNQGVTRRFALERRLAAEGFVEVGSLRDGEGVWVSNAVRGFVWGRVVLRSDGGGDGDGDVDVDGNGDGEVEEDREQ